MRPVRGPVALYRLAGRLGQLSQGRAAITHPRALGEEDDADGLHQDGEVEEDVVLLQVEEVVGELALRVLDGRAIGIVDLGPAGDAGRTRCRRS